MGNIQFIDFDKISDTIMFLSNDMTLSICLPLNTKAKDGKIKNFHSEYKYYSNQLNKESYSIKRTIQPYFSINDLKDFKNGIMLKINDVWMFKMLVDNRIMPWFVGQNRIFFFDNNKRLQIKGKYDIQELRLNDYSYLAFAPIVIRFEDGSDKEGVRMIVNSKDRYVDLTIDSFISFYCLLTKTDLYNAGANLANYVKTAPYDCGLYNCDSSEDPRLNDYPENWNNAKGNGNNNFFNKL